MSGVLALRLNGADLLADRSGALFWPAQRTLIVADLHLEKGSAFAERGQLLPPYDTAATLERLEEAVDRHRPERVVALGDSFHDQRAADRLAPRDGDRLRTLTAALDWIWVCGNHDPAPPETWGGTVADEVVLGPLRFRHEAQTGQPAAGEVSGHFHPKAAVQLRVKRVTGRCFVTDGRRLILPAFGAYAGGLDVLDPAIAALLVPRFKVYLLGRDRLFPFPKSALSPISY